MEKSSSITSNTKHLRNKILELAEKNGLTEPYYKTILDYTIANLESNDFAEKYYGYHNIDHLLEVPFCTLLVGDSNKIPNLRLKNFSVLKKGIFFNKSITSNKIKNYFNIINSITNILF